MSEFNIITKTFLAPEDQSIRFSGVIGEGESPMSTIGAIMGNPSPVPGSEAEKTQIFLSKIVPVGKQLRLTAIITCDLIDV